MPEISLERVDDGTGIPRLNVVFLHGLGGNPTDYWCHEGGKDSDYFWLRGIAEDIPGTAVWTVGYPADKMSWGTGWPIAEAATAVLDKLMSSRPFRETGEAPIAFVCHSLGGIIAKKLVLTAHLDRGQQPRTGEFLDRIAGIVFLATPHGGSILATIASSAHWFVSKTMGDLTGSNAALLDLSHTYRDRIANGEANIRHRVYFEGRGIWGLEVVTPASADPGLPGVRPVKVDRDHRRIHKPIGKDDVVYEGILSFLQDEILQSRPASINQKIDELLRRTAQVEGIPLDALRTILADMGEAAGALDAGQIAEKLKAKATEFKALTVRLNRLASDDPEVSRLRQAAGEALKSGNFAQVDTHLATAEERDLEGLGELESMARLKRLSAAESRAERAAAARLRANANGYREAANHFGEAARIAQAADANVSHGYKQQEAQTLTALGNEFGLRDALLEATEHFRALLGSISRGSEPLKWAEVQQNLGTALSLLAERESETVRLEEAIAAYRAALEEFKRESVPLDWALTQNNLGNALSVLWQRLGETARLAEAVAAYRAALEERTRERVPLDWAMTQNNLANALVSLGERESGTVRLEEAVVAYRAALEEYDREDLPRDWAMTQNNLGKALLRLGERESGTARLEEAITVFRAAMTEGLRERLPLLWAMTHNNLGAALQTLGERELGTARLAEAVAAYHAALEERTRDRVPLQWAMTQNNLGNALLSLGERERGTARLEEAVAAYRAALEERSRERLPFEWAMTQSNLGNALASIGERESETARLNEAVAAYRAALEEYTREHMPLEWARTQNNLGTVLQALGERESSTERLEEAIAAYRAALQERTPERVPLQWAMTLGSEGVTLGMIAVRKQDLDLATLALEQIDIARNTFDAAGQAASKNYFARQAEISRNFINYLRKIE